MRYKSNGYKLVSEFLGSKFASKWNINNPITTLVSINRSHLSENNEIGQDIISVGSLYNAEALDITASTIYDITPAKSLFKQLLKIALFDCWIANEDRNDNNLNLMYDVLRNKIVPIDFGCSFNTATFDFSLSPLTSTDTVLNSSFYLHLRKAVDIKCSFRNLVEGLHRWYINNIKVCESVMHDLSKSIPKDWNVLNEEVVSKCRELLSKEWAERAWNSFEAYFYDNIRGM